MRTDEHDSFDAGLHDLPPMRKLKAMSYSELAMAIQGHKPDSAAHLIIQSQMKLKEPRQLFARPWFLWVTHISTFCVGLAIKCWC